MDPSETTPRATDTLSALRSPKTGVSMRARLSVAVLASASFLASAAYAAGACENLATLKLEKAAITSAQGVEAGGLTLPAGRAGRGGNPFQKLPAFCRAQVTLTPTSDSHIEMELWLPSENWNGKFLAVGNGGWAGNIETGAMAAGLAKGYATASNDTGHRGGIASFVVGHPEKLVDFGYRSMHEMAIKSKGIIQAFYNREPQLSYYQGCSTGGRQGLMEAQRYPADFDAIIAGAPVNNVVHLNIQSVARQVELLKEPPRILPSNKVALLANAAVMACDANDGVKDGIISDP